MEASSELMQRQCIELLEETTRAVTYEQRELQSLEIANLKASQAEKQREASKQLSALKKQLAYEATQRARLEHSVANMLEDTAEQCKEQARESLEAQETRHASELDILRRQHLDEHQNARGEILKVQAARHRAEAAVAQAHNDAALSISTARQAAQAEIQANKAAAREALGEAYRLLAEPAESLFCAAARLTGGAVDTLLSPNTGNRSSSVEDLGARTKQALTTTAVSLIKTVVELGAPGNDVQGFADIISEHRGFRELFQPFDSRSQNHSTQLERNLVGAVRVFAEQKKTDNMLQLLSLFPIADAGSEGYSARRLALLCSKHTAIEEDTYVRVTAPGNTKLFGRIMRVEEGDRFVVQLLDRDVNAMKQRYPTSEIANAGAIQNAQLGKIITVDASKLRCFDDVHITPHQARQAQNLAVSQFPGALPERGGVTMTRQTRTQEELVELLAHLEDSQLFIEAEASRRNAERGLNYLRALPIRQSYQQYKNGCQEAGVRAIRYPEYLQLLSSRKFGQLKIANCVCITCRSDLFENSDCLRELVELINLEDDSDIKKDMLKRIDWIGRYLGVEYASRLCDESSNAYTCLTFALSTANDPMAKKVCSHGLDADGAVGPCPSSMNQIAQESEGRDVVPEDWDGMCYNDCGKINGKLYMCNNCAAVGCKVCVLKTTAGDLGVETADFTGWRCPSCQTEVDQQRHHNNDASMNDTIWLKDEILNSAHVVGLKASAVDILPNVDQPAGEATDSGGDNDSDDHDPVSSENEVDGRTDDAESLRKKRALASFQKQVCGRFRGFERLQAHKVRTIAFKRRKHKIISEMDNSTVMEMKDYSGKVEARKSAQGTSENLGQKLSNHGSVFVMRNPSAEVRARFPGADFSTLPPADQVCFIQVNAMSVSDDSRQSAYHMGGTTEVVYKELKRAFPWITKSIPFSDQCGDYHSTQATIFNHEMGRLTGIRVIQAEHTEPGEGKGEVDARFGILAQKFATTLAHHNRESAAQLFSQIDSTKAVNDYVVETAIDRGLFKEGCGKAIPLLSSSQCITFNEGGGINVYEAHGFGEGKHISRDELRGYDFYGIMASGDGTGSFAIQRSDGLMQAALRSSYSDKQETKAAISAKQEARKVASRKKTADKKEAMDAAMSRHTEKRGGGICGECKGVYINEATYANHIDRGVCANRQRNAELAQKNRRSRRVEVEQLLTVRREHRVSAEQQEKSALCRCEFNFIEPADAAAIRLVLDINSGKVIVESVARTRKLLACRVLPRYTVVRATAAGEEVELSLDSISDALTSACPASPVALQFLKPLPDMPLHGFARKRLTMKSRTMMAKEVVDWLETFCDKYEERGSSPRAHTLRTEMLKIGGLLHSCTDGSRFVQDEGKLFNWLKKRYTEQKTAGINLAVYAAHARAVRLQHGGAGAGAEATVNDDDDDIADDDDETPDYSSMNVSELKQELRARGLRVGGTKAELLQRLMEDDAHPADEMGHSSGSESGSEGD